MMLKSTSFIAACLFIPALSFGMNADKVTQFTAKLDTQSVVHKLYQPGMTKAPHPFYQSFCKSEKPVSYKNAKGNATLIYDHKTKTLWFAFSYAGLSGSPIMMHFHIAPAGKGGPIVQTICGSPPPNKSSLGFSSKPLFSKKCPSGRSGFIVAKYRLQGNRNLKPSVSTAKEIADLLSGKFYINIHTCLNELGEVRGQVIPDK